MIQYRSYKLKGCVSTGAGVLENGERKSRNLPHLFRDTDEKMLNEIIFHLVTEAGGTEAGQEVMS